MFERTKSLIHKWTDSAEDISLDDRRAHPRYEMRVKTHCRFAVPNSENMPAEICDLSRGGVKLQLNRALDEGSLVCIDLPKSLCGDSVVALACVMHAVPLSGGMYSHGCTFSAELDDQDLQQFGAKKVRTEAGDKRAWRRYNTQGEVRFQKVPSDGLFAGLGKITNISPSGVGLIVEAPVQPGTALKLELRRSSKDRLVNILACCVYLGEKTDDGWIIGCTFIHELTAQDIESLM
ncbi:PilZ domain-containing protein [Telmatocola sphagniphila]|uniref:PilZ domain-containing protein n=1 Tax=Telmatocola sphagniphila TaxID=1123043 RepID=A0A8E6B4R2_9BACT|nr:PilZ domain-containing protein [Telmatocola sphagniphila]QVL31887.1 PilZ domain-containing protein [Telmatocola sphagniphila]